MDGNFGIKDLFFLGGIVFFFFKKNCNLKNLFLSYFYENINTDAKKLYFYVKSLTFPNPQCGRKLRRMNFVVNSTFNLSPLTCHI